MTFLSTDPAAAFGQMVFFDTPGVIYSGKSFLLVNLSELR